MGVGGYRWVNECSMRWVGVENRKLLCLFYPMPTLNNQHHPLHRRLQEHQSGRLHRVFQQEGHLQVLSQAGGERC